MGNPFQNLSRRERQIMDSLYRRGSATASEVQGDLPDPPGYSAVRAMLAKLVEKGHITHEYDGPRYIYRPSVSPESARAPALDRVVDTFFGGSASRTIAALLDRRSTEIDEAELEILSRMIEEARRRGR